MFDALKVVDPDIAQLVEEETIRQRDKIRLIPSENYVSNAVLEVSGSVLTNKYSEGYPGKRYYEGCEIVDEVGPDAVRFFLLSRSADSQMDFDLDLAKEQSERNPVYYVQYAHARIASILRYAAEQGITSEGGDVSLLTHPSELALIRQMLLLPEVIEQAALNLSPHHLTYYAQDLAAAFHVFYRDCRVVSSDPADAEISRARLKLAHAVKIVLARTLHLMGMTAPESM